MSTMSVLDLQCQGAMEIIEITLSDMGFEEDDAIPALVAVEIATQAAYRLTPIALWECTLPYLLNWTYERFEIATPTLH